MELLEAQIQNYAWGDPSFIANMQRRDESGQPEAELWMGAHPKAPGLLASGLPLDVAITAAPAAMLGEDVASRFGELPYLAKVLAAAQPLSIQTHPNAMQAAEGWKRENDAGIPRDSPLRTYRDANHKPELICALTPFVGKCGFRPLEATRELFNSLDYPGVEPLRDRLDGPGDGEAVLSEVLSWLLTMEAEAASSLVAAVVDAAAAAPPSGPWVLEFAWTAMLDKLYRGDPGVVVALLLNHVILQPGEALFLEAGQLHAYMHGAGLELMANSDNVIRGGLTPKNVDVHELSRVVSTKPSEPRIQRPTADRHTYDCPTAEFALSRAVLGAPVDSTVTGPEVLIATDGYVALSAADGTTIDLQPGFPVWVNGSDKHWHAEGTGTLFRCHVPPPAAPSAT